MSMVGHNVSSILYPSDHVSTAVRYCTNPRKPHTLVEVLSTIMSQYLEDKPVIRLTANIPLMTSRAPDLPPIPKP